MNTYDFKNDLTGSVFRLMGRILLLALVAQIIATLVNYVLTLIILPGFTQFTQQLQTSFNPTDDLERIFREMLESFAENGYSFWMIGILFIISIVLTFIIYNLIFNGARNEVSSGDNSIGSAFSGVFDGRIVKYIVFSILLMIACALLTMALIYIPIIGFLTLLFVVLPISVWFSYVGLAAIGINNHSIGEAFQLAKNNMTAGRIAKVLGIGILVIIVFGILGLVIGLISGLVTSIPGVGVILSQIINSIIGAVMTAFTLAGAAGLYYRYTDTTGPKNEEQFVVTD